MTSALNPSKAKPQHQILLYGASNLWLSKRIALTEIRQRFSGQLQIGLAQGPGRSYGIRAGNPLCRYEALSQVDFDFDEEVPGHKVAILTDLGNDVAYAKSPQRILQWATGLADRLQQQNYRVIVGGLPVESIALLNPRLFRLVAKLYYSTPGADLSRAVRELSEVEEGLRAFCQENRLRFVPLKSHWYSYDNFHLARKERASYWQDLLQDYPILSAYDSKWSWRLRQPLKPQKFWLLGRQRVHSHIYRDLVPESATTIR